MTDSFPLPHFGDRRVSRRHLLAIGTAVPAAVVVAKALPDRVDASAVSSATPTTPAVGATSAVAASAALANPAYYFC